LGLVNHFSYLEGMAILTLDKLEYYNKATQGKDLVKQVVAMVVLINHIDINKFCLDADAPPVWRASSEEEC
jgi:hypothetical protein